MQSATRRRLLAMMQTRFQALGYPERAGQLREEPIWQEGASKGKMEYRKAKNE
jgi:hypothetical protein